MCKDYVSEKLWRAFEMGTIPIVTSHNGVPDYSNFVPIPKAVIEVSKFPT